jgi:hypothetical protein
MQIYPLMMIVIILWLTVSFLCCAHHFCWAWYAAKIYSRLRSAVVQMHCSPTEIPQSKKEKNYSIRRLKRSLANKKHFLSFRFRACKRHNYGESICRVLLDLHNVTNGVGPQISHGVDCPYNATTCDVMYSIVDSAAIYIMVVKFRNTIWPPSPHWQPIQMGHSLHIRERGGGDGLDNLLMSMCRAEKGNSEIYTVQYIILPRLFSTVP